MKAILALSAMLVLIAAVIMTGCTPSQWVALRTVVARASQPATAALPTPAFSVLATPTLPSVAAGPMGTLTAIAGMFASPTPNREPYQLVNRGKPHFIEFHAWW